MKKVALRMTLLLLVGLAAPASLLAAAEKLAEVAAPACEYQLYLADFEVSTDAWVEGTSTCSAGNFVRGTPDEVVNGGVTTQVAGAAGGAFALFTQPNDGGAGIDDVDGGTCEALSSVVPAAPGSTITVSLDYFHGQRDAGDDPSDGFSIEVLNDGVVVDTLVLLGDDTSNAAWTNASTTFELADDGNLQLRVRATDGASAGDLVEAGIDNIRICSNAPPVVEEKWTDESPKLWTSPADKELSVLVSADLVKIDGDVHQWYADAIDAFNGDLVAEISATVEYGPKETIWTVTAQRFKNRWGFAEVPLTTFKEVFETEYDDDGKLVVATTGSFTWLAVFLAANALQPFVPAAGWVPNGCNWPCSKKWNGCCFLHDACYCIKPGRKLCDDLFAVCLGLAGMPPAAVKIYYLGVRLFGWIFY